MMGQDDVRLRLTPQPRPGRWNNFRVAEYQLRQHNIYCPNTSAREEDCPNWMQMGFNLYRRLEKLGYQPYLLEQSSRQWLEVYPHACYTALLGLVPFQKSTLEGKIQRQLVLFDQGLNVSDPMRIFEEITRHRILQGILPEKELYSPGELDALVSAYTAWKAANHPEETISLGEPGEGMVIIPVRELKNSY
jgi:predicted RNase H-like nuclease